MDGQPPKKRGQFGFYLEMFWLNKCQAGADVKENLKNWAKQQEAELAEDTAD